MTTTWFEQRRDYAPIFIRLFAGVFLIYMAHDNVFSWARMLEFEKFLRQFGFPLPLVSAVISVACQFTAGILFILGAFTRWAGIVCAVNFVVAIVMVDRFQGIRGSFASAYLVMIGLYLAAHGAGRLALDPLLKRRLSA